jgi:hypothetical protein
LPATPSAAAPSAAPPSAPDVDIVVSAENTAYLGWQSALFHHSCVQATGRAPLVVVHGDEPELVEEYQHIAAAGGRIQRAPNFRTYRGVTFAPFNTIATAQLAETDAGHILLAEPDMVFLRPPPVAETLAEMEAHAISFDRIGYLHIRDENRARMREVCRRIGADFEALDTHPVDGGVPHLIPIGERAALCAAWFDLTVAIAQTVIDLDRRWWDRFARRSLMTFPGNWISGMWGLVLAVRQLGLNPVMTEWCASNAREGLFGPADRPKPSPSIIHYCYSQPGFDKRKHRDRHALLAWSATAEPPAGSSAATILAQLNAAADFYDWRHP